VIQAAINPETKQFLGLIIPKEDLCESIAIYGSAADWEAALQGVNNGRCKVVRTTATMTGANITISIGNTGDAVEIVQCPPGEHESGQITIQTSDIAPGGKLHDCI
jgi:hypothetical protein